MAEISTKPYLVRAIYEWCTDSGYRPFLAVVVDARTQVPREFVRNGEIVLNVSAEATNRLHIGNELLEFEARFGGVARHVSIPIENVRAIFAQENGHGMAFEVPVHEPEGDEAHDEARERAAADGQPPRSGAKVRALRAATPEHGAQEGSPGTSENEGSPGAGEQPLGGDEPRRATGKRATSRRSRKPALREVGADAAADASTEGGPQSPAQARPAGKRARKPSIASVPRNGDAGREPDRRGTPERPGRPDDDPGPGKPPGKPHLTRVK